MPVGLGERQTDDLLGIIDDDVELGELIEHF